MKLLILLGLIIGALAEDCPSNSHYNECGSACPITCENYQDPPMFCIRICVPGCHCDEDNGYVKTKDGRCVLPEECERTEPKAWWSADVDVCSLPFESGTGSDIVKRFGFNNALGECTRFIYTGEGGNGNNFRSLEECRRACGKQTKALLRADVDVCSLPFESGTGSDIVKRFGFNNALGECTRFIYTGEGGNGNNFESLEECRRACGKPLRLPSACQQGKAVGLCDAYFPRYFYNIETGECERFIYGGCQGNSNNFDCKEDCEAVCKV